MSLVLMNMLIFAHFLQKYNAFGANGVENGTSGAQDSLTTTK